MTQEETHKSPETDSVAAASEQSKVNETKPYQNLVLWGGLAIGLLILLFLFSGGKKENRLPPDVAQELQETTRSILETNLAALAAIKDSGAPTASLNTLSAAMPTTRTARPDTQNTSEHLARQNAPSTFYVASKNRLEATTQASGVSEATAMATSDVYSVYANEARMTEAIQAAQIPHPCNTIASGEFIQAILETAVNSDLPGMLRAVVTRPVYGYTSDKILIPEGSRLIGQYMSALTQGQHRVFVVWDRVILPNGVAVQINSPGTDKIGRAGLGADHVETHFLQRFGESILLSVIGAGVATVGVSGSDRYNSSAYYRIAIADSLQQAANDSLAGAAGQRPTLSIFQGAQINVFVAHDLSFHQVLRGQGQVEPPWPNEYVK